MKTKLLKRKEGYKITNEKEERKNRKNEEGKMT